MTALLLSLKIVMVMVMPLSKVLMNLFLSLIQKVILSEINLIPDGQLLLLINFLALIQLSGKILMAVTINIIMMITGNLFLQLLLKQIRPLSIT